MGNKDTYTHIHICNTLMNKERKKKKSNKNEEPELTKSIPAQIRMVHSEKARYNSESSRKGETQRSCNRNPPPGSLKGVSPVPWS